jgi:sugar lactone lactonase YvrE
MTSATALGGFGDLYEADFGSGNVFKVSPAGTVTSFVSGLVNPSGLAFDSNGNLFVADSVFAAGSGLGKIYKVAPDGTTTVFASGLNKPFGLAFDSAGNLFEADSGSGNIYKFTTAGVRSTFAAGLQTPAGIAFDHSGNLFENDFGSGTIFMFTPASVRSTFASGLNSPDGLTIGADGNVFEGDSGSGNVFKFDAAGTKSTAVSGLNQPNGVAVDRLGNLFVSDNATGLVWKVTLDGTATTFAIGFSNPQYLAFLPVTDFPLNISTRMRVLTGEQVLIGGFIITGTDPKRVIIRGIGPSLTGVGVTLSDPTLELHGPGAFVTITNDNWKINDQTGQSQEADIRATTIPPTNDLESAILMTLSPGAYTAILAGKNGGTGVGLVEVYDLDQASNSKLANISTRGFVDTDNNVMIGGFIVGGGSGGGARVIVRALGPSVPVADALGDPTLELYDGSGTTIASNDNWKTRPDGSSQQAEIEATTLPPTNDLESALVQTLAPGAYTAIVRGKNNTTGVGLVEAYNLH